MGLGKRSLPSRAAGTDPHVTFPVVTVSGRHSLMLAVQGQGVSGSRVAVPPCSGLRRPGLPWSCQRPPLCHLGEGKPTRLTLCLSIRPFPLHGSLGLAALPGQTGQTNSCWASAEGGGGCTWPLSGPPAPLPGAQQRMSLPQNRWGFPFLPPLAWALSHRACRQRSRCISEDAL